MRGIVSLAAALAIPLAAQNGAPFPGRDAIVFITFVVIFVTLVGQGLTLIPLAARAARPRRRRRRAREIEVRVAALEARAACSSELRERGRRRGAEARRRTAARRVRRPHRAPPRPRGGTGRGEDPASAFDHDAQAKRCARNAGRSSISATVATSPTRSSAASSTTSISRSRDCTRALREICARRPPRADVLREKGVGRRRRLREERVDAAEECVVGVAAFDDERRPLFHFDPGTASGAAAGDVQQHDVVAPQIAGARGTDQRRERDARRRFGVDPLVCPNTASASSSSSLVTA